MNSQKMIRLSVIAALAGVYGSAFAGTTYDKGTNFIDQTYENVVGTKPSEHYGAVMVFYPTNADDVFNIRNCIFSNNTSGFVSQPANGAAINWSHGGAFAFNGGTINVENSTFTKNTAGQGGAISQFLNPSRTKDVLNVKNSTFTENQANAGGAMSILQVANITDTQFVGNSVVGDTDGGGALFIGAESNVVITNTLFDGNKSLTSTGGAIAPDRVTWATTRTPSSKSSIRSSRTTRLWVNIRTR